MEDKKDKKLGSDDNRLPLLFFFSRCFKRINTKSYRFM